ncbi:hypothetical protein SAMN02746095_03303 [Acidocella aminolytica 101 = DSM 11237]|uniref:Uncharacterized protein n=1 Tax=Acidocella aminolytica 101 = DSM 11237 TaxID=1120923 RepID=A0A0D6PGA1_9PROT|nr:hypothetical protein Aam_046_047 [Acidocella aminolytica 101 = DSM 11237]GBQ36283.1 hypothetical protein AA11237_1201 [Acidocella aminolytica 101 = DSM 11237]SHF44926.1 hypothetical protein SAMN02746095_03303 [Acidocella aminolytica 101 = DSM 11237]
MRRASYRQAVEWIRTRLTTPIDPARIKKMELAIFVAFLFDVPTDRVVADIAQSRFRDSSHTTTQES